MPSRQPCALNFYADDCNPTQIEEYIAGFAPPEKPEKVLAGIVPHAGWRYSGAVAAKVFKCIREKDNPATFVLLGAIHTAGVRRSSIYPRGSWWTPLGDMEIDEEIASTLVGSLKGHLAEDPRAHSHEHSLEVQLPFIRYFFPQAKVVPISIVPDDQSVATGDAIGQLLAEIQKEVVVIGSTDLTHYGDVYGFTPRGSGPAALAWLRQNDARVFSLALQMKAESIVPEAMDNHNACGSGAMAATVSAARTLGAKKGTLLHYTTSHDVAREGEFVMGVGYAGIVF